MNLRPYRPLHFGIGLGLTVTYTSLVVLLPLTALLFRSFALGWSEIWSVLVEERIQTALFLSFRVGFLSALTNAILGFLFAWVLVRYEFPFRSWINTLVDLPFTLPTAVAGIALTTIYSQTGLIGSLFAKFGISIAYTPVGIYIALVFIGFPFVVRTVQPVLEELPKEWEESARCLGASPRQTFFRVLLPEVWPALLAGTGMAFARSLGEYGSVVFISGNIPGKTEILPLLIVTSLEQYQYEKATAIAFIMLSLSFICMFLINWLQIRAARKLV